MNMKKEDLKSEMKKDKLMFFNLLEYQMAFLSYQTIDFIGEVTKWS